MKIIKRNGSEVTFDLDKIVNAIKAANAEVPTEEQLTEREVMFASLNVEDACKVAGHTVTVEEVQDLVEDQLMALDRFTVARKYIIYRYLQNQRRQKNTTDDKILSLIESNNEEVKQENSNKNPTVVSVQRDYMAGEVSKDLAMRELLPEEVVDAHNEGIIHFHDADYYAQHMHNCDLVNLEDMLQNGTVISGTMIEKPHSFSTACNIATQIIAQVASCQYGGQSISLAHLAPFVDVSRKKIRRAVYAEMEAIDAHPGEEKINTIVEKRLRDEVARGVQTIQYQVVTLMTTNGQAPFITVFMYLNEAKNEQEKADLERLNETQKRQLSEMQAKQAEAQKAIEGLSQDVKNLMAQRDAELEAMAAERAAQEAAAAAAARAGYRVVDVTGELIESGATGSQQAVVAACYATPSPGSGLCAMWVSQVFANAGYGYAYGNANDMCNAYCYSSDKGELKPGWSSRCPPTPAPTRGPSTATSPSTWAAAWSCTTSATSRRCRSTRGSRPTGPRSRPAGAG